MKKIYCADLFCGGGGTSTGMIAAFEKRGVDYELVGVNHWDKAIETNRLNHRGRYRRDGVERVSPRELVPGGRLHILWASPECTNHSRAKGGRPKDEQSRATAWDVLKWPQELFIDRIYIENVEEFLEWGPCDETGHPIAKKKGEIFRQYIRALKAFGYRVDYQVMNAADFGAPTCRRRLIIQAVRGRNQKIRWPEPTHAKVPGLFGEKPWRAAREIIDWNIRGTSIFERKKPLAANTLRRIYSGIAKHGGRYADRFGVALRREIVRSCKFSGRCPFDVLASLPPVAARAEAAPFITVMRGTSPAQDNASIRATGQTSAGARVRSAEEPMFVSQHGGGTVKPVSHPLPTIATTGSISVVSPVLVKFYGREEEAHSVDKPLGSVTCKDHFGLADGQLVVDEWGRFLLLDILFRMRQPHELAAAMSFPENYKFAGTKSDQVKQIGNAVCPALAEALIAAALDDLDDVLNDAA